MKLEVLTHWSCAIKFTTVLKAGCEWLCCYSLFMLWKFLMPVSGSINEQFQLTYLWPHNLTDPVVYF